MPLIDRCPFCRSDNVVLDQRNKAYKRKDKSRGAASHFIRCRACYARGPLCATKWDAMSAWNRPTTIEDKLAAMPQERQDRIKAEADRLAALDDLARLGQEYDAETEAGGSIIQGLREAAEYTKGMLVDGDDLIRSEVEFLRSTATDIETGEPLDDDARPDLYAIDARRIANHIETVERELVMWRSHCFAAEARANQMKAALIQMRDDRAAFRHAVHFRRFIAAALTQKDRTDG